MESDKWKFVREEFEPMCDKKRGGLAQLARAPALHAGGQRFESVILHKNELGIEI